METVNFDQLKDYFENTKGVGVFSTADKEGKVNAAIYARPHFMEDGTVAVIMNDRLTHANIRVNPHAAFLFIEEGKGYKGKRLYLTMVREEEDSELLYELKRRQYPSNSEAAKSPKFLVFFTIEKALPLVGAGENG